MEPPARIRLVLADAHPIVLRGMLHCLQAEADLEVMDCCTSDEQTIDAVARNNPAGLMLDLRLPRSGGLAVLRALSRRGHTASVALLTDTISENEMSEAVQLGVRGVVLKEMAPQFFVQCIRHVCRGGTWFEHEICGAVLERMSRRESGLRELRQRLTRRELQVLQLVAEGLRNIEITDRLKITEGTVKNHLHNIYGKLGTGDRLQLALRARDSGLV